MLSFSILIGAFLLSVPTILSLPLASSPYAPVQVACPIGQALRRPAGGLCPEEESYRQKRKAVADAALMKWLDKIDPRFLRNYSSLPTIALTTSGGGYRTLLSGAGVIQGLDDRDSNVSTSGLFQALTYHSGLSGGAWLLSSMAGNNWPTVSSLKESLWKSAFERTLFFPNGPRFLESYSAIIQDVAAKATAGFLPTLTDPWGRLLSYQLLNNIDGGASITLSSVAEMSNCTSYAVPYPIITSLGVKYAKESCPKIDYPIDFEFTPFEFGSWSREVNAFTPTEYMGTSLDSGKPTQSGSCVARYDSLSYILGTSSTIFNALCPAYDCVSRFLDDSSYDALRGLLPKSFFASLVKDPRDDYATYPNPFYVSQSPYETYAVKELYLVDGAEARQNNPIEPMLRPGRGVDVLIVNDNSADSADNFPTGAAILQTFEKSSHRYRMPEIPSVATFLEKGFNKRATFFGCEDFRTITMIYLPNSNYVFASNRSTAKLEYSNSEVDGMVANGVQMASQGGDKGWATALACAMMLKVEDHLPDECQEHLTKYCYKTR